MSYIKARTENGVRFEAPLSSKADYQRVIRFLEQEMVMLNQPNKKAKKQMIPKSRGDNENCEA